MNGTATLIVPKLYPEGENPSVGKDLLELLSIAMYENPLTLYREFIQNAADSIDEARANGLLASDEGSIEIHIDQSAREVRIRDNGTGIPADRFVARMRSVGSSSKRGTEARGFRGVGRLSGLAYAQRMIFRSRSSSNEPVRQITWDCRKLRAGLKDEAQISLPDFISQITDLHDLDGEWPERFFEVELSGVIRLGDDRLIRPETVSDYLAQVAPVPFSPEFSLASGINDQLGRVLGTQGLTVTINGQAPIARPYRDQVEVDRKPTLQLRSLETFEVPAVDGGVAACGWIAHHDYHGAIPDAALIKGLRVRVGNIQVGSSTVLAEIFPEPRFASWVVGEVHVLDKRIVPNGRRDGFEQNAHYSNLLNHLGPIGRAIAKQCRTSSSARQRRRTFELQSASAGQKLQVLEQQVLGTNTQANLAAEIDKHIASMDKIAQTYLGMDQVALQQRVRECRLRLSKLQAVPKCDSLGHLSTERAAIAREFIGLIYECLEDTDSAKALVDKILARLE